MKILMIHPHDLYSNSEPWSTRIKNIACHLKKRGHAVKLVYFPLDKDEANEKFIDKGIEVITMDRRLGAQRLLKNIIETIKLADWCDIIHFQKWHYYVALPALIATWLKNKPIHYDWDDWETKIFYYSHSKIHIIGQFINIYEKLLPKVVNTVSVSSKHLRKLALRRGVPEENIFLARVGVDLQQFNPDLNPKGVIRSRYNINNPLVMYVGQLHGGQYAELFIKAAHHIIKKRSGVTFMIVGDGYRLRELKKLSAGLNFGKHFIFTGAVIHDEIPCYVADADICVACFEENNITRCKSPLKIAEYMGAGKAIVASRVGEVPEMVGEAAVLTKAGDYNSLAEGIITLLDDGKLRQRIEKNVRERAERQYNWSVTTKNLLRAYQVALKAKEKRYGN